VKQRDDIKNYTRPDLINWFLEQDYAGFRGKQVFNWLYRNFVDYFSEMKNLPEEIIELLKDNFNLYSLNLVNLQKSAGGTVKYLWELPDQNRIESVFLPYYDEERYSVCLSSQVGCDLGCKFCATGLQGLERNLKTAEIVEQAVKIQKKHRAHNLTNLVFMGMGEPMNNLDAVLKAAEIFNDNRGFNIGQRRITISTSGIIPGIRKLAESGTQIGLAVSINAPNDQLRSKLMPINNRYPLGDLIPAVKYYIKKTGRRVTFEYILIEGLNDHPEYAVELARLLEDINCHLNLIPVNYSAGINMKPPDEKTINQFKTTAADFNINVTVRKRKGSEINAACGQLKSDSGQEGSNEV